MSLKTKVSIIGLGIWGNKIKNSMCARGDMTLLKIPKTGSKRPSFHRKAMIESVSY